VSLCDLGLGDRVAWRSFPQLYLVGVAVPVASLWRTSSRRERTPARWSSLSCRLRGDPAVARRLRRLLCAWRCPR